MPISPDRCKSRAARSRHKNRAPSCDFRYAKLLVLLVGGPDDFVAGASRAHPTRPLRGGRITRVGQPNRLRRQANVAIHNRSLACGTIPQTTEVAMSRLERKVVIVVHSAFMSLPASPSRSRRSSSTGGSALRRFSDISSAVLYVATPIGFTHMELQQIKVQRFLHIPILPH